MPIISLLLQTKTKGTLHPCACVLRMKPLFPRHRHIQHIQHTQSVLMIYPGERCQLSLCGSAEISQRNAKRAGYVSHRYLIVFFSDFQSDNTTPHHPSIHHASWPHATLDGDAGTASNSRNSSRRRRRSVILAFRIRLRTSHFMYRYY